MGRASRIVFVCLLVSTCLAGFRWGTFTPWKWQVDLEDNYGFVIDAGSHGSRIHMYRWPPRMQDPDKAFIKPVTVPSHIRQYSMAPGISLFLSDPASCSKQIHKLVEMGKEWLRDMGVKESKWKNVPISLNATAGMRNAFPDVRSQLFSSIRNDLQSSGFLFQQEDARVIAGEEEGVFGWLALNVARGSTFAEPRDTLGALDMGGASAQVSYRPVHTSIIEDSYEQQLGGRSVRLYSHSYLGYGWDDALSRVNVRLGVETVVEYLGKAKLGSSKKTTHSAEHPCFPLGYEFDFEMPGLNYPEGRAYIDVKRELMDIFMTSVGIEDIELGPTEAVSDTSLNPMWPQPLRSRVFALENPFVPSDTVAAQKEFVYTVRFSGSGDYHQCRERAKALFYKLPCFTHNCAFNGVYQPRLEDSRFMAFGQYGKVAEGLQLPHNPSLTTMESAVRTVCSTKYPDLETKSINAKFCWKAMWSHVFLVDGIGFSDDTRNITFAKKEDSLTAGWTGGAVISQVNQMPYETSMGRFKFPFYLSFVTLLVGLYALFAKERQVRLTKSDVETKLLS